MFFTTRKKLYTIFSLKHIAYCAGPEHPWLVSIYGKHAPHPFGSVVGEEIFQSGFIPGDTDFRMYHDYGGLPGTLNCFVVIDLTHFVRIYC